MAKQVNIENISEHDAYCEALMPFLVDFLNACVEDDCAVAKTTDKMKRHFALGVEQTAAVKLALTHLEAMVQYLQHSPYEERLRNFVGLETHCLADILTKDWDALIDRLD